jgi:hypothetical protein
MRPVFNVYCDESCHLERDRQRAMVLGAVWCSADEARRHARELRGLKTSHGLAPSFEVKWTKVSPGGLPFYQRWIDYFFAQSDLHFRALIVPDKSKVDHTAFPGQDHDQWYYKMYFDMLKVVFDPRAKYRVYLDIKDTRGAAKVRKLHDVLCNNQYDFRREIIERVQQVRSHEVELLQLADLLIGAVSAANREITTSTAKRGIVEQVRQASGYALTHTTLLREDKFNLFRWHARELLE